LHVGSPRAGDIALALASFQRPTPEELELFDEAL
jgi:hypothetical protein